MQLKQTTDAIVLYSSDMLQKQFEEYLVVLQSLDAKTELQQCIQERFIELSTYYINLGNQELSITLKSNNAQTKEVYVLHYAFPETFKEAFLLHRDVLLQLQITTQKELEGAVVEESALNHLQSSIKILTEATAFAIKQLVHEQNAMGSSEKEIGKRLNSIKHRQNPWSIYREQFEDIAAQIKDISLSHTPMTKAIKSFGAISQHSLDTVQLSLAASEMIQQLLGEAMGSIKAMESIDDVDQRIQWIERTLIESEDAKLQEEYTSRLELQVKLLGSATIPIHTENGSLLTRQLDFNKAAQKWFDFEIIPLFIDLWEHRKTMETLFNHSLLNLKSSLLIEKSSGNLDALPAQLQTLQSVHHALTKNADEITQIAKEITTKVEQSFQATAVYKSDDFLDVSIQSSISQFASSQGNIFEAAKKGIVKKLDALSATYEKGVLFSTQSDVDQSIACIYYRMFKEVNAHYDTLFLNKNFIGDVFIVERDLQEFAFAKAKKDWDHGFNKAVVVNGSPMSGKTTFVESIAQKHFKKKSVFLTVDSVVPFQGRKINTSRDLGDALLNIKKNLSGTRPLLVIDSLEDWQDENYSILENTRALLRFIESESDNVFVVVSLSSQMQMLLDQRLRFSAGFSTRISMNKASFEEIYKAFLIRHGASHKVLVSEKREALSKKQIESHVLKLARECHYNIGEVFQSWTYGTTLMENNQVVYAPKGLTFKDFFSPEDCIILKAIYLHKAMNELRLKSYVDTQFENSYKPSLKRLTNLKVLLRNRKGQLYMNPVLINDIKDILIYRGILSAWKQ